jgi:hypothetical protein
MLCCTEFYPDGELWTKGRPVHRNICAAADGLPSEHLQALRCLLRVDAKRDEDAFVHRIGHEAFASSDKIDCAPAAGIDRVVKRKPGQRTIHANAISFECQGGLSASGKNASNRSPSATCHLFPFRCHGGCMFISSKLASGAPRHIGRDAEIRA